MLRVAQKKDILRISVVDLINCIKKVTGIRPTWIKVLQYIFSLASNHGIVSICNNTIYIFHAVTILPDMWIMKCTIFVKVGDTWYKVKNLDPLCLKNAGFKEKDLNVNVSQVLQCLETSCR